MLIFNKLKKKIMSLVENDELEETTENEVKEETTSETPESPVDETADIDTSDDGEGSLEEEGPVFIVLDASGNESRAYTEKLHGADAEKLATQYAEKIGGSVK